MGAGSRASGTRQCDPGQWGPGQLQRKRGQEIRQPCVTVGIQNLCNLVFSGNLDILPILAWIRINCDAERNHDLAVSTLV